MVRFVSKKMCPYGYWEKLYALSVCLKQYHYRRRNDCLKTSLNMLIKIGILLWDGEFVPVKCTFRMVQFAQ